MRWYRWAVALACASIVVLVLGGPVSADTTVSAKLKPLNGSGASGTVTLTAGSNGSLTVVIHAHGLVPGQPHAQHIHGSLDGGAHFMCPSMEDDTNGDGVLTNEEATGEYGTIYFALTTRGDSSARSGLDVDRMPVADANGNLDYQRTFAPKRVPDVLLHHLSELHVVQHGIDPNGNGKYDLGSLGASTFARNLGAPGVPEEATDPATCGLVTGAGSAMPPHGGIETGGGPADGHSQRLALLGGLMVAAAAALVAVRVRPKRARTAEAPKGSAGE